jgi:hypothetical protein
MRRGIQTNADGRSNYSRQNAEAEPPSLTLIKILPTALAFTSSTSAPLRLKFRYDVIFEAYAHTIATIRSVKYENSLRHAVTLLYHSTEVALNMSSADRKGDRNVEAASN